MYYIYVLCRWREGLYRPGLQHQTDIGADANGRFPQVQPPHAHAQHHPECAQSKKRLTGRAGLPQDHSHQSRSPPLLAPGKMPKGLHIGGQGPMTETGGGHGTEKRRPSLL